MGGVRFWKSGGSVGVLAWLLASAAAWATPPANDLCADAIDLNAVAKPYISMLIDARDATPDTNANPSCDSPNIPLPPAPASAANNGVWWKYTTGPTSERINFQLPAGSSADHVLSLWTGPDCNTLTQWLCTDGDAAQQGLTTVLPKASTFYIMSSLWSSTPQTVPRLIGLTMTVPIVVADPPANGTCDGATTITAFPYSGTPVNYSTTFGSPAFPSCGSPTYFGNRTAGGVWFTFTPTQTSVVTLRETSAEDVTFSVWTGSCAGLTQFQCGDGGTGTTESIDVGPLIAGTQYFFLLSRGGTSSASRSWPTSGATLTLTGMAVVAPPAAANDLCANAIAITTQSYDSGALNVFSNTNDSTVDPSCDNAANPAAGIRGVWFTFTTGATSSVYTLKELNSLDAVVSVWTGADCTSLTQFACDDANIDTGSGWVVALNADTEYRILVSQASSSAPGISDTFRFAMNRVFAPANDDCATAILVPVPGAAYTQSNVDIRGALPDIALSCNVPANTPTLRGIWHKVTPTLGDTYTLTIGETGSEDTIRAVFTGSCGTLTEVLCANAETGVTLGLVGGTTYFILTGQFGAPTTIPTNTVTVTISSSVATSACCTATACTVISKTACTTANGTWRGPSPVACNVATNLANACRPAPANDTCATATLVSGTLPQSFTTATPASATDDRNVSCNSSTNAGTAAARFGVWYTYTTGPDSGVLRIGQTGANDTIRAVFSGTCDALVEVACVDAELDQPFSLNAQTQYFILNALPGNAGTPTASYTVTLSSFTPTVGTCCNVTTCSVSTRGACPGAWRGSGTTCNVLPTYATNLSAPVVIPDASLAGVSVPLEVVGSTATITDLKVSVSLGTHTYAGDLLLRITGPSGASVDLFARPGGSVNCNPPVIALAGSSNDINAGSYLFDDAGTSTLASAILVGSISSATFKPGTCGAGAQSLNAMFAGTSPNGVWTLTAFDLSPGDTGTITNFGVVVNNVGIGPCDEAGSCCNGFVCSVVLAPSACPGTFMPSQSCSPDPCAPPTVICCRGTTCAVIPPAECVAPSTVGALQIIGATCNALGSAIEPCCYIDFNKDGSRTFDDLFIYLNAWFLTPTSPFTRIAGNGTDLATFDDLFSFISLWFAGGCG